MIKLKTGKPTFNIKRKDKNGRVLVSFKVSPITMAELENILKENQVSFWEAPDKRSSKQRVTDFNNYDVSEEAAVQSILGWEGVGDDNGKEIDCTPENIRLVYKHNRDFIQGILDEADDMAKVVLDNEEKEAKNLKNSQSGKQKLK